MISLLLLLIFLEPVTTKSCGDSSRDCSSRKHLCNSEDESQRKLVQFSCQYTCRTCQRQPKENSGWTGGLERIDVDSVIEKEDEEDSEPCRDLAQDCHDRRRLCRRALYKRMMSTQCALTCGFCNPGERSNESEHTLSLPPTPRRIVKPRGRSSKIATLEELENSGVTLEDIINLIKRKKEKPRNQDIITTTTTTQPTVCLDTAYDCIDKIGLCNNKSYATLVARLCKKTCNLCP